MILLIISLSFFLEFPNAFIKPMPISSVFPSWKKILEFSKASRKGGSSKDNFENQRLERQDVNKHGGGVSQKPKEENFWKSQMLKNVNRSRVRKLKLGKRRLDFWCHLMNSVRSFIGVVGMELGVRWWERRVGVRNGNSKYIQLSGQGALKRGKRGGSWWEIWGLRERFFPLN